MGFDTPSGSTGAPADGPYLTSSADPDLTGATVVDNPENIPAWVEDTNSPASGTDTASVTLTLGETFDVWRVVIDITNESTSAETLGMRLNGDTGSNYTVLSTGGTKTSSSSRFPIANLSAGGDGIATYTVDGRWANACGIHGGGATDRQNPDGNTEAGDNVGITSPLDSITVLNANATTNVSATIEAYGKDIG